MNYRIRMLECYLQRVMYCATQPLDLKNLPFHLFMIPALFFP